MSHAYKGTLQEGHLPQSDYMESGAQAQLLSIRPLSPSQFPTSGVYLPTRGQGPVVGLPGSLRSLV